jgi:hypothetical protein
VSTVLSEPPDLASGPGGGMVARRAVLRWGWRLFRREWRQQLLVLALLTVAVAATAWGSSVVTNAQLANPNAATLGTAAASVTLPGSDPHLAADIATIRAYWGPADLIESSIVTGAVGRVQLRAESPHGHYNAPLLGLVSGSYPAGPGQVALTSHVASLSGTRVGGTWWAAGTTWRVTGIVQNPSSLPDQFALVAPGQVAHPGNVVILIGPAAARRAISGGNGTLPGVPAASVSFPTSTGSKFSPATVILLVEVLGLVFIGLVSVAGFSVMAQRRLRSLGMLGAIGATERNLRLVMIASGLAVGVAGALAGAAAGLAAWFAYVPSLQQASGHVVDAVNLPWWALALGVAFAVAASVLASSRPARAMAAVPVVTALSGRPAPPDAGRHLSELTARLHARPAVPLKTTGATLHQAGAQAHKDFTGTVYVATPQLLAAYGIRASQIAPGTDVLTMRPGMASLPRMELTWGSYGIQQGPGGFTYKDDVLPSCTLSGGCLASPAMQTVSSLPGGTSAPNTVITEYAVHKYRLQTQLTGWLIQAPAPLTAAQIRTARQFALVYGATVETESSSLGPGEIADSATAFGIVLALGVLAMSVGLIRSEAAPDLRTLTATGASGATRRMITAATAAVLGLLGAILGMTGAVIAGLAWARSSLSVMFGDVPVTDVLILLIGLPLIAAASGWLLAGREPPAVARQPID